MTRSGSCGEATVSLIAAAAPARVAARSWSDRAAAIAVMWRNRGTHVGEWSGFSPTGKSATAHGVDIHLLRDGRLAEHWDVVDISDFLMAVGADSAPAGTAGAQQ